jgi:tripartite motif-containing protein 71
VTDINNNHVQKFDSNGKFITKWGSPGSSDGQFKVPIGVIVDPSGYVYVVDAGNKRIQVFAPSSNQTITTS